MYSASTQRQRWSVTTRLMGLSCRPRAPAGLPWISTQPADAVSTPATGSARIMCATSHATLFFWRCQAHVVTGPFWASRTRALRLMQLCALRAHLRSPRRHDACNRDVCEPRICSLNARACWARSSRGMCPRVFAPVRRDQRVLSICILACSPTRSRRDVRDPALRQSWSSSAFDCGFTAVKRGGAFESLVRHTARY